MWSTRDTGHLRVGDWKMDTTCWLGRRNDAPGATKTWAFPGWATIPASYSVADGRRWHLLFAWLLSVGLTLYMHWMLFGGHLRRDLHVPRAEWSPRHIWRDVKDHARQRFPKGADAASNGSQPTLSYIGLLFVALQLMHATRVTQSPCVT